MSEKNVEDEPSIFLGLNFNAEDSADDQVESNDSKNVVKENTTENQTPFDKINKNKSEQRNTADKCSVRETNQHANTSAEPTENENKNNQAPTGLASLMCYGSSDDES